MNIGFKMAMVRYFVFLQQQQQKCQKQMKMNNQGSGQGYFISSSIFVKYDASKVSSLINTYNRIAFFTHNELIVINQKDSRKTSLKVDIDSVVRFVASRQNQIAILYKTGTLQIRQMDHLSKINYIFGNIQFKPTKVFPIMYWEEDDIYILTENRLEVFSLNRKERKAFSQFISKQDSPNLLGMVESKLIDKQRVIIMHLNDRLMFNIAPIPITQMYLKNITKALCMSSPKYNFIATALRDNLPREFLIIVIEDRILQVYNLLNMKQLLEIKYDRTDHQSMIITTDRSKQLLLVTFITKKNIVNRNLLYKVNTQYYYKGADYFGENQDFFQFEVQLQLKEILVLFPPKQIQVDNCNKYLAIDLAYRKHFAKRNKGQIIITTIILDPLMVKNKKINNFLTKQLQWKELRQWKDIISSYIEMKKTFDKIGFNYFSQTPAVKQEQIKNQKQIKYIEEAKKTSEQQIQQSEQGHEANNIKYVKKYKGKRGQTVREKCIREGKPMKKPKDYLKNIETFNQSQKYQKILMKDKQIMEQFRKENLLIQEQQRQIQKYEKLQSTLMEGAYKFQNQTHQLGLDANLHDGKKLEEQFYKFMRQYLRQKQINIDPQTLLHLQIENGPPKQGKNPIKEPQPQKYPQKIVQELQIQTEQSEKGRENKKQKKKPEKNIPSSKSSEQLNKNTINLSSAASRTKSTTNEELQDAKQKNQNKSHIVSSFSGQKLEIMTKSQQNLEQSEFDNNENQQIDKFSRKLTDALTNAFKPLEQRFDRIQQKVDRLQSIHLTQLKRCERLAKRQQNQLNNIDIRMKGYCYQLLDQFDKTLQKGVESYLGKIEEMDKRANKNVNKTIQNFSCLIDTKIKSRLDTLSESRHCIQNNLTHIRKKLISPFQALIGQNEDNQESEEDDDDWEQKYRTNAYEIEGQMGHDMEQ